jgi:hypothetical protein
MYAKVYPSVTAFAPVGREVKSANDMTLNDAARVLPVNLVAAAMGTDATQSS